MTDLIEFSKSVPLSKIHDYVKQKTNEKGRLEEKIEDLKVLIENFHEEESDAMSRRDKTMQVEEMTSSELKLYTNLREKLRKYKIPFDISKLVKVVGRSIKEFSELESIKTTRQHLRQDLQSFEDRLNELDRVRGTVELRENLHKQFLHKFDLLENMGFGLKELDFIRNTVNDCSR